MYKKTLLFALLILGLYSCKNSTHQDLDYERIKEEVMNDNATTVTVSDTTNMFDGAAYDPEKDSFYVYLDSLQSIYENDSAMVRKAGLKDSNLLTKDASLDSTISNKKDSFSAEIKKMTAEEIKALKYNLKQLHDADSILKTTSVEKNGRVDSRVWARVSKKDQRLYLYIDGKIVDTFKVSTGSTRHETPTLDMQPNGPIFQKYTSKKYPGGNYNGLGNMPYVVFIRGGYAIHGTTRGNIPRLGNKASHGCVRIHPDNAKIFNELVRKAGLENTWVTIEE